MNVRMSVQEKQHQRISSKTSYATQTLIQLQLCPDFPHEERQNRSANSRYTKIKRTLYKAHNCSLGQRQRRQSRSMLLKNFPVPSVTILNNFLTSQKFKINSRLAEPILVTDDLLKYLKNKSEGYSKGNPHVVCQTPELRISIRPQTSGHNTIQRKEQPQIIQQQPFKSKEIIQKSQSFLKRGSVSQKKDINYSKKISEGRRLLTASTTFASQSQQRQESKQLTTTNLLLQKPKLKPILIHDWRQMKTVKSESYAVMEYPSGQLILSFRSKQTLEIASLTKIMTCYLVIKLAQQHKKNLSQQTHIIGEHIQESTGTTAQLIDGDCYTIEQLLYGLMLPSGNDAALALADWGGSLITKSTNHIENIRAFVNEMNARATRLGLKDSRYGNPHGLPSRITRSTALDICLLSVMCMDIPLFRKIVSTKHYKITVQTTDHKSREVEWQNTNKLLRRQGFIGIKTGITVTAGPCLASAYNFRNKTYIVTLLRASKVSRRFTDSRIILQRTLWNLFKNDLTIQEKRQLEGLRRKNRQVDSDNSEDEQEFQYQKECNQQYAKRNLILKYQL